jgi:hypothetical protein
MDSISEKFEVQALEYAPSSMREQLICPVCQLVLTDPYSTVCGHTFCKECIFSIRDSISGDQTFRCPVDRHPLTCKDDVNPAAFLVTSLLNELPVYCPFQPRGCPFEGKRWNVETHVYKDCGYVKVPCPGCSQPIERRYTRLDDYEEIMQNEGKTTTNEENDEEQTDVCVHVKVECPKGCGERLSKYKVKGHLDRDCVNVSTECSACKKEFPKPELASHEDICPKVKIPCSASTYGCTWNGPREEFSSLHSRDCVLVQVSPVLNRQQQRMELLEQDNRVLRFHVERLTNLANNNQLHEDGGRRPSTETSSSFSDSDLLHIFMECERLRKDVDRLTTTLGDLEVKQSMVMMRENCRTGEEIANLRAGFNGLRHQLHFLLAERRSMASASRYHESHQNTNSSSRPISELFQGVKL